MKCHAVVIDHVVKPTEWSVPPYCIKTRLYKDMKLYVVGTSQYTNEEWNVYWIV